MATSIVSPEFCTHPYPIDLVIDRDFRVADINGNTLFNVEEKIFTLHNRHILLDAADNPILTFRQKTLTAHKRWRVFRGDSSDKKDLLFSVKMSCWIQVKIKLKVFLASNTSEDVCDFKIKGSWFKRSCTIYAGDSTNIIAQMHKKLTMKSVILGKGKYAVTVYPNVDYAFIVALIFILEQIGKKGGLQDALDLQGQVLQIVSG